MVTLQVLVLSFPVRIRVVQHLTTEDKQKGDPIWNPLSFLFTNGLLDGICKFSTSLELCDLLSSNLNLLLGCGVDTLTSGTLAYAECTETNEGNLVTCYEGTLNSSNCCVKSLLCVNL